MKVLVPAAIGKRGCQVITAKLCSFAIISLIGIAGLNHTDALAAESNVSSMTLSENNHDYDEGRSKFREEMKEARSHWDTLTANQKDKVYDLIENELTARIEVMEQLAKYQVLEEDDVAEAKSHMIESFKERKANGEFPLSRKKCKHK